MTKPDYADIYAQGAAQYERLISREDYEGNLLPAIRAIRRPDGLDIVDIGAGTGRLTRLLAPFARSIRAFDTSPGMLRIGWSKMREMVLAHPAPETLDVTFAVADHRALPLDTASCDMVVAGWSLCYAALHHPDTWREETDTALAEIGRVLRPGGTTIVIETLGTGRTEPQRSPEMEPYLARLDEAGFESTAIRTDYLFSSAEEAQELVRFFFGAERADAVRASGSLRVPECTGLWWR